MLPADEAAASLHRRLHVSLHHITQLHESTADAPAHIAKAILIWRAPAARRRTQLAFRTHRRCTGRHTQAAGYTPTLWGRSSHRTWTATATHSFSSMTTR
eukprot:2891446-Prymnesium_polylepis.1